MGSFMTLGKLGLGKGTLGVVEGVVFDTFNPKRTTVGVIKASGGIVYFNVKGTRVKVETASLEALNQYVGHLGQIKLLVSDAEALFEGAVPVQQVPWKNMTLQEYLLTNGTVAYCVAGEPA